MPSSLYPHNPQLYLPHQFHRHRPCLLRKHFQNNLPSLAAPIYYYEMCGQMKTLLDRLNPLYSADYLFRDIYMIATAAENDESAFEKAYNGLQGWVDCFEKALSSFSAAVAII